MCMWVAQALKHYLPTPLGLLTVALQSLRFRMVSSIRQKAVRHWLEIPLKRAGYFI